MEIKKNTLISSLTVSEFLELINKKTNKTSNSDLIFIEDLKKITNYKESTIYSKVSKNQIPVISRGRPLIFSRKEILNWLQLGKPNVQSFLQLKK